MDLRAPAKECSRHRVPLRAPRYGLFVTYVLYVHTGRLAPKWFIRNVLMASRQWGESVVAASDNSQVLRAIETRGISAFRYSEDVQDRLLEAAGQRSAHLRHGFWTHAIRRFLVLSQFQQAETGGVWMIESDVVLLPRFKDALLGPSSTKLLMPYPNGNRVIGSTLYSPNADSSTGLADYCLRPSVVGPDLSDMHLLYSFAMASQESVAFLPTAEFQARRFLTTARLDEQFPESAIWNDGNQIWDAAALGQYLFGYDPRNSFGLRRILASEVKERAFPNLTKIESSSSY